MKSHELAKKLLELPDRDCYFRSNILVPQGITIYKDVYFCTPIVNILLSDPHFKENKIFLHTEEICQEEIKNTKSN